VPEIHLKPGQISLFSSDFDLAGPHIFIFKNIFHDPGVLLSMALHMVCSFMFAWATGRLISVDAFPPFSLKKGLMGHSYTFFEMLMARVRGRETWAAAKYIRRFLCV
jgi:hypothetical protein